MASNGGMEPMSSFLSTTDFDNGASLWECELRLASIACGGGPSR